MKTSKSWYQRWWVWVLIALGAFIVIGIVNSPDDATNSQAASAKQATSQKSSSKKATTKRVYKVGETATIDHVQVTVTAPTIPIKIFGIKIGVKMPLSTRTVEI